MCSDCRTKVVGVSRVRIRDRRLRPVGVEPRLERHGDLGRPSRSFVQTERAANTQHRLAVDDDLRPVSGADLPDAHLRHHRRRRHRRLGGWVLADVHHALVVHEVRAAHGRANGLRAQVHDDLVDQPLHRILRNTRDRLFVGVVSQASCRAVDERAIRPALEGGEGGHQNGISDCFAPACSMRSACASARAASSIE